MRVKGGVSPDVISIEPYMPIEGYVEIRVRENINEVSKDNGIEFEYDEYTFRVPDREGLKEDIETNLNDWLVTGRTIEVNEGASIIQDMKSALAVMGVNVND